jgi:predicted small lipoprotein YifL
MTHRRALALIVLVAGLSACGQTGPLYLPDEVPDNQKPPSQRNKKAEAPADDSGHEGGDPAAQPNDTTDAPDRAPN